VEDELDILADVLATCCESMFAVDTCILVELVAEIALGLERRLVECNKSDVFELLTMEGFVCEGSDAIGLLAVELMLDDKDVLAVDTAESDDSTELLTVGVDCGIRTRLVLMIVTALELGAGS
jgi:hypothetical protein